MKFYNSGLASVVWDSEKNRVLARFEEGEFTTEDKRTQKILKEKGYGSVDEDDPQVTDRVRPRVSKPRVSKGS